MYKIHTDEVARRKLGIPRRSFPDEEKELDLG